MKSKILLGSFLVISSILFSGCIADKRLNDIFNKETQNSKINIKQNEIKEVKNSEKLYSLEVEAPSSSIIKIMNIKPKYYHGILLRKGKYKIKVIKSGYKTYQKWIKLENDRVLKVNLSKRVEEKKDNSIQENLSYGDERPEMESSKTVKIETKGQEETTTSYDDERPEY